ncbi:MAG: hypothetical protein M3115_02430 [Thermoproteota archaeon]|nr:hypothetical protein [Thermoproteota archaeon]
MTDSFEGCNGSEKRNCCAARLAISYADLGTEEKEKKTKKNEGLVVVDAVVTFALFAIIIDNGF